jgi:hypothetical protein
VDTAAYLGDAKYFMVKNFINNTYFFEWDEATTAAYFKRIPGAVGITIPKLVEMAAEQVDLASVPFATFIANKKQSGASAMRCGRQRVDTISRKRRWKSQ